MADFLIYGSYGYAGELIARQAVESGLRPTLAGRDAAKLAAQAGELGLDYVSFSLDDPRAIADALRQVPVRAALRRTVHLCCPADRGCPAC